MEGREASAGALDGEIGGSEDVPGGECAGGGERLPGDCADIFFDGEDALDGIDIRRARAHELGGAAMCAAHGREGIGIKEGKRADVVAIEGEAVGIEGGGVIGTGGGAGVGEVLFEDAGAHEDGIHAGGEACGVIAVTDDAMREKVGDCRDAAEFGHV